MSSYHSQQQALANLPPPTPDEIERSLRLVEFIKSDMNRHDGVIPFNQFMNHALYHPGLGYYSAGQGKFGESGDFVTAPEISPLFGATLARQVRQIIEQGCTPQMFEFGAGSGKLCEQLITNLPELKKYSILEISADLRDRQQSYLKSKLSDELFERIAWLDSLPVAFNGIVVANEVLDAMPVNLVRKNRQWRELGVGFDGSRFDWREFTFDSSAIETIKCIEVDLGLLPENYCTEVNLNYLPWLNGLNNCCQQAAVLIIDYGYEQPLYYHPERSTGTLICHYRHRVHPDPLVFPGLQDITAFVDFDAFADAAVEAGFELCGMTSQGQFLLANGLLEEAENLFKTANTEQQVILTQQIKTLTLPAEMGDKFKVVVLQKNIELNLPVFSERRLYG